MSYFDFTSTQNVFAMIYISLYYICASCNSFTDWLAKPILRNLICEHNISPIRSSGLVLFEMFQTSAFSENTVLTPASDSFIMHAV